MAKNPWGQCAFALRAAALAVVALPGICPAETPDYRLKVLDVPAAWPSTYYVNALRVSNNGAVLVDAYLMAPIDHPRHYFANGSQLIEIPTVASNLYSTVRAASNNLMACGSNDDDTGKIVNTWYFDGHQTHVLETSGLRATWGINASGQIIGNERAAANRYIPLWWNNGVMSYFDRGGYDAGDVWDINDDGTIVGWIYDHATYQGRLAIWRNGVLDSRNIQAYGRRISAAGSVLAKDVQTGESLAIRDGVITRNPRVPVVDRIIDLNGINDSGDIVAATYNAKANEPYDPIPWLCHNGVWSNLNDHLPASTLARYEVHGAGDINNSGVIATWVWDKQAGQFIAAVMEPVPEPGTWLALGLGSLAVIRRRKARA